MWGRVAVACRLNQYSTVPFTSYSMRCIKTCFIETRILTTPTFFTSHPTCWLVIVQEVKWNWSENCWVFGRLECAGLRGQPLPWFSEVSFKRISSCKMHTRSHYITKIYRPGSKCEALQLGVHLILLYFIRISLLSAETFFFNGWWMVDGRLFGSLNLTKFIYI